MKDLKRIVLVKDNPHDAELVLNLAKDVKPVDFQEFVHVMKHLGTFWALVNEHPQSHPLLATHTRAYR